MTPTAIGQDDFERAALSDAWRSRKIPLAHHVTSVAHNNCCRRIIVIDKLPPRERQVFDALYAKGEATAAEIQADMTDPPSNSAVRIMLSRLEKKGFVTHRVYDQKFVYSTALPERNVRQTAVRHFIRTFFGGSPVGAAAALIGMSETLSREELDQLEEAIAKARREDAQ
jgi:predicted transcriptional regulator